MVAAHEATVAQIAQLTPYHLAITVDRLPGAGVPAPARFPMGEMDVVARRR